MAAPAAIFREIHRLRRHAQDLQDQIDRGPRLLKVQQAKITQQEDALRQGQEALKRLKVSNHEKEGLLKATLNQITKHERQLNEAASKKEYDALRAEIESDRRTCQRLEDDILNTMEEIEHRAAQIPELEKGVQRAREEYAEFENNAHSRQADLVTLLGQALQTLKDVEGTLSADVRPQYDRLTAARGEDALAAVQDRTCTACYTGITAQNYNELIQGQFVFCKTCGRILYLPE
jgi:predicted  nucleic acid-binding Zn-ribbon protein